MTRKKLKSYLANERLIERNRQKIEDEKYKDIPVVMGKVKGSAHEFPYIEQRFAVQMSEPVEADKVNRRIIKWEKEIEQAEKEMQEIERFISEIHEARDREILTYRYIDGMKVTDIACEVGYTHSRISQIISKYVED